MSLASEDRSLIRDLAHEIRDVQKRTNELLVETNGLLKEIRDAVRNPPVTISEDRRCSHQKESELPAGPCSICGDRG